MSDMLKRHPRQLDFIAGQWCEPDEELGASICNPSTGSVLQNQMSSAPDRVLEAIAAADELDRRGTWRNRPEVERAEALERIADHLDASSATMAEMESLGTGVVISVARLFAESFGGAFRDAATRLRSGWRHADLSEGDRTVAALRQPWGPTAILVPWNAPVGVASKKVAYALGVGAPVLLKANEWAPFGCNVLAEAIAAAELPIGAFQLVHGGEKTGSLLVSDPRVRAVSFTGSVNVGRKIAQAAAANFTALQLELSGSNPAVVLDDADISATADAICAGMVKLNGEWCEAPRKVFVPATHHDALVAALQDRLERIRIGGHDDPDADVGPLAHESHRQLLDRQVEALADAGGVVHAVGELPDLAGWFWAPRVVTNVDARECEEEMFGPLVTVHSYTSQDEVLEIANDSPYGLAAYVFGSDVGRAMQVGCALRYGEVKINGTSILDLSPDSAQSFWRNSGIGGHGDDDVFAFFCGKQIVGVDRSGLPI